MMPLPLHLREAADGYPFAKLACRQLCLLCLTVLIAFWLDLPIVLRILCLLCPNAGQDYLRFVRRLLFFSLRLFVFVLLELLPSHHGRRAYHHQLLNQIVAVVRFELLLLIYALDPLPEVAVVVHYLRKLRRNAMTEDVVSQYV